MAIPISTQPAFPVLCVDLDGTLVATDVLLESILLIARKRPLLLLYLPFWAFRGIAYLKRRVAASVALDVTTLPYRGEVLAHVTEAARQGRTVVLATGADEKTAHAIADHLGVFSQVLASNGRRNLTGTGKAARLVDSFGYRGFEYVGNDWVDIPVWQVSGRALLVDVPRRLQREVSAWAPDHQVVVPRTRSLAAAWRVMRAYQWAKNTLLFVPVIAAHHLLTIVELRAAVAAFVSFSLCASGIYILNDLLDIEADRQHPRKRTRPFATGSLSIPAGIALMTALLATSLAVALTTLPLAFTAVLAGYLITTTSYSMWLKREPVADVFVLAGLYALRVFAGGIAIGIPISTWLLAFALFFFLSLAFAKRYAEVRLVVAAGKVQPIRGYVGSDQNWLLNIGLTSGYLAVVVLALYVTSVDVVTLYSQPRALVALCPLALYWLTRMWFRAQRGGIHDDPLIEALRDPTSYLIGIASVACMLIAIW